MKGKEKVAKDDVDEGTNVSKDLSERRRQKSEEGKQPRSVVPEVLYPS
jgi:hypothetical protein